MPQALWLLPQLYRPFEPTSSRAFLGTNKILHLRAQICPCRPINNLEKEETARRGDGHTSCGHVSLCTFQFRSSFNKHPTGHDNSFTSTVTRVEAPRTTARPKPPLRSKAGCYRLAQSNQ